MKEMKKYNYHMGMRMRIYPSAQQKILIKRNGSCARFVYNRLVAVNSEMHQLKKTAPLCPADAARLRHLQTAYNNEQSIVNSIPFLSVKGIDSDMIKNERRHYTTAWKNFKERKEAGIPKFHKFDHTYSYQTSNHYSAKGLSKFQTVIGLYEGSAAFLDSRHIKLPCLGRVRFAASGKRVKELLSRTAETRIGTVTIEMDAVGNCYAVFALASDVPFHDQYEKNRTAVGADLNLLNFMTDSDNLVVDSPRYMKQSEHKLKKAQRKLSRRQRAAKQENRALRTSKNYQKQRIKLAEIHCHVANQRSDFLWNLADLEVKSHDYLFAEDLKVRNMMKNHRLAKAISDSGWRSFLTKLRWCAEKRGKICLLIDPKHTTQTCSACGYVMTGDERIPLGREEWDCPVCRGHHIRDYNAAVNIKNTGIRLLKEQGIPVNID